MDTITLGFLTTFLLVLFVSPSLIKVAKLKHLVDEPSEERKLHKRSIPTIGGVIIFASIIFSFSMWFPITSSLDEFKFIVACMILLFFVGIKDDIIGTAPMKKLVGHMIVGFILVMMADIKISGFHGFFGLSREFPDWAMLFITVFVYIAIVNALNLIDGIDGLAGGVGFICSLIFGFWFHYTEDGAMALLAFATAGAMLGFLIFNFSPARIFMGDSGSLIVGMIMSVLAIKMVETPPADAAKIWEGLNTAVLAMAILVYPLTDTLRVFIIRAVRGQSPFTADKNHIHHRYIARGWNHRQTVSWIYVANILIVVAALYLPLPRPELNVLVLAGLSLTLFLVPPYLIRKK